MLKLGKKRSNSYSIDFAYSDKANNRFYDCILIYIHETFFD
jgi:hypothetical protein